MSPTATFNPDTAILLGQQLHVGSLGLGLPPGQATNTVTETLPNGLSGTYYLFVQADSTGEVIELPSDVQNKLSPPVAIQSLVASGRPGRLRGQRRSSRVWRGPA